jgi:glutathione S-transferase
MKLYLFPPSLRVLGIVALKNHLSLDCEVQTIDLGRGDQLTPQYLALNPNNKMPTLEDDGFVLWESNAILFYMAAKRPDGGLWPSDLRGQAEVLRWLAWESAHWDAESWGMVVFEKASKAVLNDSLRGKTWLVGERLTIADFSIAGFVPLAERMALPVEEFPEILRWYRGLAALPAWQDALTANDAAMAAWRPAARLALQRG